MKIRFIITSLVFVLLCMIFIRFYVENKDLKEQKSELLISISKLKKDLEQLIKANQKGEKFGIDENKTTQNRVEKDAKTSELDKRQIENVESSKTEEQKIFEEAYRFFLQEVLSKGVPLEDLKFKIYDYNIWSNLVISQEALIPMFESFKNETDDNRKWVLATILSSQWYDEKLQNEILDMLLNDSKPENRFYAATMMKEEIWYYHKEIAKELLSQGNSEIASVIARNFPLYYAITDSEYEVTTTSIQRLLLHENPNVRNNSLIGYSNLIRNETQLNQIIDIALKDSNEEVRKTALQQLQKYSFYIKDNNLKKLYGEILLNKSEPVSIRIQSAINIANERFIDNNLLNKIYEVASNPYEDKELRMQSSLILQQSWHSNSEKSKLLESLFEDLEKQK